MKEIIVESWVRWESGTEERESYSCSTEKEAAIIAASNREFYENNEHVLDYTVTVETI